MEAVWFVVGLALGLHAMGAVWLWVELRRPAQAAERRRIEQHWRELADSKHG